VAEGTPDGTDAAAEDTATAAEATAEAPAAETVDGDSGDAVVPAAREDVEGADEAAEEEAGEADEDRGEPLFEVSDRRATILADKVGIIFRLDEEEADFTWDEVGAVEIDTPRFAKRFKVTVYTGPRRWFEAHVEAPSRSLLKKWAAELDAVLDEHFEEPDSAKDEDPAAAEAAAGTAAEDAPEATEAEAKPDAEPEPEPEADAEAAAEPEAASDDDAPAEAEAEADKPEAQPKPKPKPKRKAGKAKA
jgi:hypothetical protein